MDLFFKVFFCVVYAQPTFLNCFRQLNFGVFLAQEFESIFDIVKVFIKLSLFLFLLY